MAGKEAKNQSTGLMFRATDTWVPGAAGNTWEGEIAPGQRMSSPSS